MQKNIFVSVALFVIFASITAQAADVVQVEPAKVRLSILPGESSTGTINVYNRFREPKSVRVYLEDWEYLAACDGTKDFKPAGTTPLSATNWISFVPSEFTIPTFGSKVVNYTVRVPRDASGGHYAVLFFENYLGEEPSAQEGVNVNLAVRVASLFYIEPKGTIERQAKIGGLAIERIGDRFNITADFTNSGNVDITAKTDFFIIDTKGMVYARGEFNEVYTFPGQTSPLTSYWKEKIPKGKYDLILTADISKALKDAGQGEVPAKTYEAQIEIGVNGEVTRVGGLK